MGHGSRRLEGQFDLDVALSEGDALHDLFDDPALLVELEVLPVAVEILSLADELIAGREADLQEVELTLQARHLIPEAVPLLFERAVTRTEPILGDVTGNVEVHVSIRRLGSRLRALDAMSPSTLFRCLASYELAQRVGGVSTWKHLTASHLRAVLPAPVSRQEELLDRAENEHWPVSRLESEATRLRLVRRRKRGRPRFAREIPKLSRFVLEDRRFNDIDRASELTVDELRDFCATLVGARRRCDDLHRLLASQLADRENEGR